MTPILRLVVAFVRRWTDVYTWRMDPDVRAARIAQIESDLWEELRERSSDGMRLPLSIIARVVLGIPDDLAWRTTHDLISGSVRSAAFGAIVAFVTLIAAIVVWVGSVMSPAKLPEPPSMMLFSAAPAPPQPTPPPPPPPPR